VDVPSRVQPESGRVVVRAHPQRRSLGALLASALLAGLLGACTHSRNVYVPGTAETDPYVERLLVRFEQAVNEKDANGVCQLYAYPAQHCGAIWRERLRTVRAPIDITLMELTHGCAGDTRVTVQETTQGGQRLRTLTVVMLSDEPDYSIIDAPVGKRLSSLVIPRYGDCADPEGDVGAPNLDPATRDFGGSIPECTRQG